MDWLASEVHLAFLSGGLQRRVGQAHAGVVARTTSMARDGCRDGVCAGLGLQRGARGVESDAHDAPFVDLPFGLRMADSTSAVLDRQHAK